MVDIKDQLKNAPYFDDYEDGKKFYRVLFRPRFAVQARELTQLQTIFQAQLDRMGQHFFKEGAMVIPGISTFDTNYSYVKVYVNRVGGIDNSVYFVDDVAIQSNFLNKIISSETGVKARIVNYTSPDENGVIRLYVKYFSSGTESSGAIEGALKKFLSNEVLTVEDSGVELETISDFNSVVGAGTGANIKEGVYFTNGFFAVVSQQSIVVDPENQRPTVSIGLNVTQSIVTPEEDESLLDNAQGSPNYAAPGAHRLKIDLVLSTRGIDKLTTTSVTDKNFIELIRLIDGIPATPPNKTNYNLIQDELARRTFDESGNYTIKPFVVVASEFLNTGTNGGYYTKDMLKRTTPNAAELVGQQLLGISGYHVYSDGYLPGVNESAFLQAANERLVYQIDPGKAYVKGYEIEKLDRSRIVGRKALEYVKSKPEIARTMKGPFVRVTDIQGVPTTLWGESTSVNQSIKQVLLFSRTRSFMESGSNVKDLSSPYCIGTARILYFDFEDGTPGTEIASYRLHLTDIEITKEDYSFEHVQCIYQDSEGGSCGFTGDVVQYSVPYEGATITVDPDNTTLRGIATGDGVYWRTTEYQKIGKHDCLVHEDSNNDKFYYYAVTAPLDNQRLQVDASDSAAKSNITVSRLYTDLEDQDASVLLYIIPKGFIRSIDEDSMDYTAQKTFVKILTSNQITITLGTDNGVFPSYTPTEWFFADSTGDIVKADDVTFSSSTSVTISFPAGLSSPITAVVPCRISGSNNAKPKSKTLRTGIYQNTGSPSGQYYVLTPSFKADLQSISLGVEDVIRVKNIYMSSNFSDAPTPSDLDISDRYELDNGQRDSFYDLASIKLKRGAQPPTGRLAVVFDYFEHSVDGIYFSVESYPVGAGFNLSDIPTYVSTDSGTSYPLADVLDFRSTKSLAGTFKEKICYVPEGDVFLEYEHFLHRNDKIYLKTDGVFGIKEGVSSLKPMMPDDPIDGMVVADVELPALTKEPKRVLISHRNNRRYTMRDIGKIEDRITQIEYYTSLSLLEKNTETLVIKDADGNDRFKNGFLVDNFRGHAVGDTTNQDYICAVDPKEGELRPAFVERAVELKEVKSYEQNPLGFSEIASGNAGNVERAQIGYTMKNDLIMLPYESVESVSQRIASDFININPFDVVTFVGQVSLSPESDEFKNTEKLEPLSVNFDNGLADALTNLSEGLGTVYTKDATQFSTDVTGTKTEIDSITSPPLPGPAFGNGGRPNQQMQWINNRMKKQSDLQRRERDLELLKGKLSSEKDKKARKGLTNKIKSIEDEIKKLKKYINGREKPPQNKYPRLQVQGERTITSKETTARGGVKLNVTPSVINQSIGENVKEINFAEFCRSQIVQFSLNGFKPNTGLYAFIDNLPVTHFCIPASAAKEIIMPKCERPYAAVVRNEKVLDSVNSVNDIFPVVSGNESSATNLIHFSPVQGGNNASGAFPLVTDNTGSITGYLFFPNGDAIYTSTGKCLENSSENPKLKTGTKVIKFIDSAQNIQSDAESSGSVRFECKGLIEKKQETILSTRGAKLSTEYDNFTKTISTSQENDYKLNKVCWVDPIAETINITDEGGAFITGVTLYFRNKPHLGSGGRSVQFKDRTGAANPVVPVSVEIRETIAGVPGPKLIPGSKKFLYPNQIVVNDIDGDRPIDDAEGRVVGKLNISVPLSPTVPVSDPTYWTTTTHYHYGPYDTFSSDPIKEAVWNPATRSFVDGYGPTSSDFEPGFIGTYFEFDYPVYLQEKSEYAVVVMANTQDYEVWYARIGQALAGKNEIIQNTASYNGVFLKSANSSTWTPDQQADLMFKLHKAEFDITKNPIVTLVNQDLPFDKLKNNPFKVEAGCNVIKVFHKNHGMRNRYNDNRKPRVKISGVSSSVGGIDPKYINTESSDSVSLYHDVTVLDFDSYSIEIFDETDKPKDAQETNYSAGGASVFASADIQVDELIANLIDMKLEDTDVQYNYRITSGAGVHGSELNPYVLPDVSEFESIQPGENVFFEQPKLIASVANEGEWNLDMATISGIMTTPGNAQGSSKSLFVQATLSSSNPNITPVLDVSRSNVGLIGNKVSDPGLLDEFKAFADPTDYVFFGFKTDSAFAGNVSIGTEITVGTPLMFHIDGFLLVQYGTTKNLRKITNIVGNLITVDKPFTIATPSGASIQSSALDVWAFGDEEVVVAENISASISGNSFSTTNVETIATLSEIFPGTLIGINGTSKKVSRIISVIRPDSTSMTIRVEDDLTGLGTTLDISVFKDVINCSSTSVGDYATAREVGKTFLSYMKPGQYITVMNSNTGKNDATYEITKITEVLDSSPNYKLRIEVKYDVDYDPTPNNISILGIEDFFSDEAPTGHTAPCKYVTKRMILRHPATALKVKFLANVQDGQTIEAFAKMSGADENRPFDEVRYIRLTPVGNKVPGNSADSKTLNDFEYEEQLLAPFTQVAIKLVLTGNDSTKPIRVRDLQVIALDS